MTFTHPWVLLLLCLPVVMLWAVAARGPGIVAPLDHAGPRAKDRRWLRWALGVFDAAMVGFGIRNLTNMPAGLKEMCRVLKPGGAFVCLEFARPTNPFFSLLYDIYSFTIMPAAGKIFAGSRKAYCYLPESIRVFPPPERVKELMAGAGFTAVTSTRLTNGIAVLYRATKP